MIGNNKIVITMLALLLARGAAAEELTLRECLEQARRSNPSLRVAAHDRKTAFDDVRIAGSAALPRLDLQAGYTWQVEPQAVKIGPSPVETQQANYAFASAGISQTLYDFGRTRNRRERASFINKSVTALYRNLEQDVTLQVISGYYAILQAQNLVEVARDEVSQREQHLQVARNLYSEGVTTRNDLLQAEVKLSGSRQKLLAASNSLENAWLRLNYLTGEPVTRRGDLKEDQSEDESVSDSTVDPSHMRQDIQAQRELIRSDEATVGEVASGFYPEIYLKAGIDYLQNDKVVEQSIIGATLGLRVNLYDGLATTYRQRQAVEMLQREKDRLRGMEEEARLELQTARNDMSVARERIAMTKDAILQSEENLRINRDRYQAQVGTATDVVDAQTLLSQARSDHYQAIFDYRVARARVLRATGEL